jgi:hypothetical protein
MAETRNRRPWGRALASAATGRLNLFVAGASAIGAAIAGSVPVLAIGAAAYAALVAWDLATPETWAKAIRAGQPPPPKLPDPGSLGDEEIVGQVRALLAAKRDIAHLLEENPSQLNEYLKVILTSLTELEQRAARLVSRGEELSRYLGTVDIGALDADIARAADDARTTSDAEARADYERARAAREQQRATIRELETVRDRVHANLDRIVAVYQGLPARIVHMRALDQQAMDALSGDVNQELDRMNQEIGEFEDTIRTIGGETK